MTARSARFPNKAHDNNNLEPAFRSKAEAFAGCRLCANKKGHPYEHENGEHDRAEVPGRQMPPGPGPKLNPCKGRHHGKDG
jgi:hypothetical protein